MGNASAPACSVGAVGAPFVSASSSASSTGGSRLERYFRFTRHSASIRPILGLAVPLQVTEVGNPLPVPRFPQEFVDALEPVPIFDEIPVVLAGLAPVRLLGCRNHIAVEMEPAVRAVHRNRVVALHFAFVKRLPGVRAPPFEPFERLAPFVLRDSPEHRSGVGEDDAHEYVRRISGVPSSRLLGHRAVLVSIASPSRQPGRLAVALSFGGTNRAPRAPPGGLALRRACTAARPRQGPPARRRRTRRGSPRL